MASNNYWLLGNVGAWINQARDRMLDYSHKKLHGGQQNRSTLLVCTLRHLSCQLQPPLPSFLSAPKSPRTKHTLIVGINEKYQLSRTSLALYLRHTRLLIRAYVKIIKCTHSRMMISLSPSSPLQTEDVGTLYTALYSQLSTATNAAYDSPHQLPQHVTQSHLFKFTSVSTYTS
ncbi:Protein of unknown function [Cotesia congregata]|uniref:Uncharacterized protein n=1 Tax=Cotesia congregata TaxID=51543 RepID=A0A8J2MM96_COTCN|nr:Protein of unknown function [Cotesia congregata]